MKAIKVITFCYLLLLLPLIGLTQNFRLTYIGNGTIQIENLLSCDAQTRVAYIGNNSSTDTTVLVPGNSTKYVTLNVPGTTEIRIKADGSCSSNGWITTVLPYALPIRSLEQRPPAAQRHFFDFYVHGQRLMMSGTYKGIVEWEVYSLSGRLLTKGQGNVQSIELPQESFVVKLSSHLFTYQLKTPRHG